MSQREGHAQALEVEAPRPMNLKGGWRPRPAQATLTGEESHRMPRLYTAVAVKAVWYGRSG